MILEAELAAAFLETPTALFTNKKSAPRASKGERMGAEATPAEGAAPAREQVSGYEGEATERSHGRRDPGQIIDMKCGNGDADTRCNTGNDDGGDGPDATNGKFQKQRHPGPGESKYGGSRQRSGQTEQGGSELRGEADARQTEDQSDKGDLLHVSGHPARRRV